MRLGRRRAASAYGSVLGGEPQDLKYRRRRDLGGDRGGHRHPRVLPPSIAAPRPPARPRSASGCFIMSYVHLAHDCHVGDGVIIANGTQLAGHVTMHDRAILSRTVAGAPVRHASASYAFIGGCPGQPGHAALREGGGQSGRALRSQLGRPAAGRLPAGNHVGASSAPTGCSSTPISTSRQAHRARPRRSCRRCPKWNVSSNSSRASSARRSGVSAAGCRSAWSASARWGATTPGISPRFHGVELVGRATTSTAAAPREVAARARDPRLPDARQPARRRSRRSPSRCPRPRTPRSGSRALDAGVAGADGEATRGHAGRGRRAGRDGRRGRASSCRSGHIERFNRAVRAARPYLDDPRFLRERAAGAVPAARAPTWRWCSI